MEDLEHTFDLEHFVRPKHTLSSGFAPRIPKISKLFEMIEQPCEDSVCCPTAGYSADAPHLQPKIGPESDTITKLGIHLMELTREMLVDDLDFTQTRGATEMLNSVFSFAGERVECGLPFSEKRLVFELWRAAKTKANTLPVHSLHQQRLDSYVMEYLKDNQPS